jgi:hypothetical protein
MNEPVLWALEGTITALYINGERVDMPPTIVKAGDELRLSVDRYPDGRLRDAALIVIPAHVPWWARLLEWWRA